MRAIISGGGTGGHIFPAIAIANEIKQRFPDADILFIGAKDRMEMEKVPQAGFPIDGLWISGLQRRLTWKNLAFPLKILCSWLKARRIIKQFAPDIVIGVGGYSSGPTLRAAQSLGIPYMIQEQNSYPGITNKMLAKRAKIICTAYDGMEQWFPKEKTFLTGNPVRNLIVHNTTTSKEGKNFFELDDAKLTVLIIGGSLGAGTINESIAEGLNDFCHHHLQIIWQTGKNYYETAVQKVRAMPPCETKNNIKIFSFITEMDKAYAAADIVVSRAGAIAISELCLVGKPTILVPSPNVAEDHQTKNAQRLSQRQAALLVKDTDARKDLPKTICDLAHDDQTRKTLQENILKMGIADADKQIVDLIKKFLGKE